MTDVVTFAERLPSQTAAIPICRRYGAACGESSQRAVELRGQPNAGARTSLQLAAHQLWSGE